MAANALPEEGVQASSCFLGVCIMNATRLRDTLGPQVAKNAGRKVSTVVQEHFPDLSFQWLDEAHGVGFLPEMEEVAFRRAAELVSSRCQLHLTIGDDTFAVNTRLACTWFPSTLEATPQLLLDVAEHLLVKPRDESGFQFVTIRSQEDVMETLGRGVDLHGDLGLSQKGNGADHRLNKRIPLNSPCVVRHLGADATKMGAVNAKTQDVSQGGLALYVPRELRTGEIIEIELRKADGPLFVAGRITHYRYVSVKKYLIGVSVVETSDEPIISANPTQAAKTYAWFADFMRTRATTHCQ